MERLSCHVKEYEWGKRGSDSEVARLFAAGHKHFRIDDTKPYAELWMGTHPDGAATLNDGDGLALSLHIAKSYPNLASLAEKNGTKSIKLAEHRRSLDEEPNGEEHRHHSPARGNNNRERHLPFIMKIMSIRHTLSLQVHPTKEQAFHLHRRDPKNYPDANHKPELAYALTKFELLCGFRPAKQIAENMRAFPQLRRVLGEDNCRRFCELLSKQAIIPAKSKEAELKRALKDCLATMLRMQMERPHYVVEQLHSLFTTALLEQEDQAQVGALRPDTAAVMRSTYQRFPTDVGCFSPLLLNHMVLQPGECCYYAAQELHAYLSGECVECVGCSNNTIRAALTPKFVDAENLVEVLNYRMTEPEYYLVEPRPLPHHPHVVEYAPNDCEDFTLHRVTLPHRNNSNNSAPQQVLPPNTSSASSYSEELPVLDCASILVVVAGAASCEEIFPTAINGGNGTISPQKPLNNSHPRGVISRGDIFYIPAGHLLRLHSATAMGAGGENGEEGGMVVEGEDFLAFRTFSYAEGPDHASRIVVGPPKMVAVPPLQQPKERVLNGDGHNDENNGNHHHKKQWKISGGKRVEQKVAEDGNGKGTNGGLFGLALLDTDDDCVAPHFPLITDLNANKLLVRMGSGKPATPAALLFDVESEMDGFL